MKICWDILNKYDFYLTKNYLLRSKNKSYHIKECLKCEEEFIGEKNSKFCSISCSDSNRPNPNKGKKIHTEESKLKLSLSHTGEKNPFYSKRHTEETRKKIRDKEKGSSNPNWKGGYNNRDIPIYNTYAHKIDYVEEVRRNKEDINILEVKCTYCGRWFTPTRDEVNRRCEALEGRNRAVTRGTEYRLYCSSGCKKACPIYGKTPDTLMKEDAVRAGRLNWLEMNREVQPELRQIVLLRDEYQCVKCKNTDELHCHHIHPVATDPLLSADIDNCITLCVKCHKQVHKQDGCGYGELRINICN